MTNGKYILTANGKLNKVGLMEWVEWFETADRHIGQDILPDGVKVSTVFLGIDHNWSSSGPPLLFETMIFGGKHDQYQERYATMEEAKEGHRKAVELAGRSGDNESPKSRRT